MKESTQITNDSWSVSFSDVYFWMCKIIDHPSNLYPNQSFMKTEPTGTIWVAFLIIGVWSCSVCKDLQNEKDKRLETCQGIFHLGFYQIKGKGLKNHYWLQMSLFVFYCQIEKVYTLETETMITYCLERKKRKTQNWDCHNDNLMDCDLNH